MKYIIFSILSVVLTVFSSCENQLEVPVNFDFTATSDGATYSGDTMIINSASVVNFTFNTNADMITFYSGENGHEYSKRNMTQTPVSDIDSCYLTFTNKPQFGNIPGTLKVYLSTSFKGLTLSNKSTDSISVLNENWINLTDSCNISTTNNVTNNSKISLKSYVNSKVTLAFLYNTTDNTAINSLNASMTKQYSILNQILDAMNKNNKYTSGILQASM